MKKKLPVKEGKKRRKWAIISCRFCVYFRSAIYDKGKGYFCAAANKWVSPTFNACPRFDLGQIFMCPEFNQVIFIENCFHRQGKQCDFGEYHATCKKCKEGKVLNWFVNGTGIVYNIEGGEDEDGMDVSCSE